MNFQKKKKKKKNKAGISYELAANKADNLYEI